jgi:hypothetical protein
MKELEGYEPNEESPEYKGRTSMDEITIVTQIPLPVVVRVGHICLSTQADFACQAAGQRFLPSPLDANVVKIGSEG